MATIASGDHAAFALLYDELSGETFGLCRRAATPSAAVALHAELWTFVWRHAAHLSRALESSRVVVLSLALAMLQRIAAEPRIRCDSTTKSHG